MVKLLPHIDNLFAPQEEILDDKAALAAKSKVMRTLRWNSILNSVSTIGALIGGPLLAAGVMGMAQALFGAAGATGAAATAVGTFAAIGGFPVVALLGVGALFVGVSVASSFVASRIWQSKNFDTYEVTAKSTAKHMVEELKGNHLCVAVNEAELPKRADGKTWRQYAQERQTPENSRQLH